MADVAIREIFWTRRVAGGTLVFVAVPITLIWLRFGWPLQYQFADLIFAFGCPGLLALGLWAAFPMRAPAVRLLITDDQLVIHPGPRETLVPLDVMIRVTKTRPLMAKFDRLDIETADAATLLNVAQMTHEAADIISLISIRLERRGKHLVEGRSDVLGAPTGVWDVVDGNPFESGL